MRSFVIALALGTAGAVLSSVEESFPALSAWVPTVLFPSRADPQIAQAILSNIATPIMTLVSILARSAPVPFVPVATVTGAMTLVLVCDGCLI